MLFGLGISFQSVNDHFPSEGADNKQERSGYHRRNNRNGDLPLRNDRYEKPREERNEKNIRTFHHPIRLQSLQ